MQKYIFLDVNNFENIKRKISSFSFPFRDTPDIKNAVLSEAALALQNHVAGAESHPALPPTGK